MAKHNPEKRSWRGRSYKTAGVRAYRAKRISELKVKADKVADREQVQS